MFTHLRIKNFKAWEDTGPIRLTPLTVFFGTNSSGKSSLNQFLLMLKQTAQSSDRQQVLYPGDKNTVIDLGSYRDLVHGHHEESRISFELQWELPESIRADDVYHSDIFTGKAIHFQAEIGLSGAETPRLMVHRMLYRLGNPALNGLAIGMKSKDPKEDRYELISEHYRPVKNKGFFHEPPAPTRFYGFPDEVLARYQNVGFVQDLTLALEKGLQELHYLGPLRYPPQRSYAWSGEVPEHVGWRGERSVDAILASSRRRIAPGFHRKGALFGELVAAWLKEMGLIDSFEVKPVAKNRREYEVLVRVSGIKNMVNVTDVGFGVSQVLPVIVACFYAKPGAVIIMEQPEIHLHPSVQSWLADLFIEAIAARENSQDRRIQLLIESHSEHFLRRLQRRIAEAKTITPEQTALYFCRLESNHARIDPLDVNQYGDIVNWPADFFGNEMGEIAAKMHAGFERRRTVGQ